MGFGLVIESIKHLQNITTSNYDSLTELHTPKITVTTAHIKSSQPFFSFIASGVGLIPLYCGHFWPIVPAPDDR
jgi:hypothetical protein